MSLISSIDLSSINLLWFEWSLFSLLVLTFGILVLYCSELIPGIFHRIVKYGKSANVKSYRKLWYLFEIPKRYFYHFYLFALILYVSLGISASIVYFNVTIGSTKTTIIQHTKFLLSLVATSSRQASGKLSDENN